MYHISTPLVVILDRIRTDPRAEARLNRMLDAIHADEVVETDDAGLARLLVARGLVGTKSGRTGAYHMDRAPVLIFGTFRWDTEDEAESRLRTAYPELHAPLMLGTRPWTFRDHREFRRVNNYVCQSAWEVHVAHGCLHACDYCHVPPYFPIMLDLEELADRLKAFGETIPDQQLYKFDNYTDTITLEPEFGASQIMVDLFANWTDRYLLLYTKSDNVDHLLDLDHRGKTLVSWSLGSETVAQFIEKRTPSMEERLVAMEKCEAAGYPVRARISPICPVRNWRTEYADLIEQLLDRVNPDVISVDVIGWMTAAQMVDAIDTELFADAYRAEVDRQVREGIQTRGKHLFPHEMRAEILRFVIEEIHRKRPNQAVSLCNETADMWRELGTLTAMTPAHYVCCCGPTSVPGNPLLSVKAPQPREAS